MTTLIDQYDRKNNNSSSNNNNNNAAIENADEDYADRIGNGRGGGSSSVVSGLSKRSGSNGRSRMHRTVDGVINMDYDNETQRSARSNSTISTATHTFYGKGRRVMRYDDVQSINNNNNRNNNLSGDEDADDRSSRRYSRK